MHRTCRNVLRLHQATKLRGPSMASAALANAAPSVRSIHVPSSSSSPLVRSSFAKKNVRRPSLFTVSVRNMFIQTETTPNPQSLKFLPGRAVLDDRFSTGVDFTPKGPELRRSLLAKDLFAIDGIVRVFFGKDFISVTKKNDDIDWDVLRGQIFGTIMDFYASGKPIMTDEDVITDTTILDTDDEVVAMIKELLETRIRPALQLAGSCAGCPSSSVTLKNGVENMLMHYIPEVRGIEEIVDDEDVKTVNESEFQTLEAKLRAAGIPSI
ncbi:hypothetical protein AaE_012532 [Aphanomyces astaci]|uniref:Scaffold protein Nfu/NifU N-terminal domain-containing protein n=1 Tax=Aphanomyces astaci TaxID=112090 RepID=A0A6A4ZMV1_APHAT|nr:hypothetical protein AaE_012532 [Aphanomyces astaci]